MTITAANVAKTGYYTGTVIRMLKPFSEDHDLTIGITASRTSGVSPCTVVFSCHTTTDAGRDSHEAWRLLGYAFDFDDTTSGTYNTIRGGSKNITIGGPIGVHTFLVADGGGSVVFDVVVTAENPEGDTAIATIPITVQAQDDFYAAGDTIGVSDTLDTGDASAWETGHDRNLPVGASRVAVMPAFSAVDGKRIMFFRGDDMSTVGNNGDNYVVRYGEKNVMFTYFGDDADAKPFIGEVKIGSNQSNGLGFNLTDAQHASWGGYCENITVDGLKLKNVQTGRNSQHVGFHDCDMDMTTEDKGGGMILNSSGQYTAADTLPANTPYSRGFYVSEVVMRGSTTLLPSNNIIANFNMTWMCVVGCDIKQTDEHNVRIQGMQYSTVQDSDILGEHIGGGGPKHCIAFRGSGYNQVGDYSSSNRSIQSDGTEAEDPYGTNNLIQRNTVSPGDVGDASWNIQVAPTSAGSLELLEDTIVRDNDILMTVLSISAQINIAGRWITEGENTYDGGVPTVADTSTTRDLDDIDLGSGTPSLTPNYINASAIPVPTAPRS